MKYRNTITDVVIDVESEMSGCWEPVEDKQPQKPKTGRKDGKPKEE